MDFMYRTRGTCAVEIRLQLEGGKVHGVTFAGGCDGNLKGICQLVEGVDAREVIAKLEGIRCGRKPTSCPDQLAQALKQALAAQK